jgi:membrane-bound ClpP family serine protease
VLSTVGRGEERLVVAGDESLIGSIGVIIIATRGAHGPGEVLVKIRGGSEAFIAWSDEPIPRGSTVLVINNRGTRTVDVSPWIDPLNPFPGDAV